MEGILSYYYFTGETVDGDEIYFETFKAITDEEAQNLATADLAEVGGGHIDAFYAETDEFAFDVEV